jgi:hypothetical protein
VIKKEKTRDLQRLMAQLMAPPSAAEGAAGACAREREAY